MPAAFLEGAATDTTGGRTLHANPILAQFFLPRRPPRGTIKDMSEHLLKFLLSELKTVRIHCRAACCGGVAEIPIDRLGQPIGCPLCRTVWMDASKQPLLKGLGNAVAALGNASEVSVEFVLPEAQ